MTGKSLDESIAILSVQVKVYPPRMRVMSVVGVIRVSIVESSSNTRDTFPVSSV